MTSPSVAIERYPEPSMQDRGRIVVEMVRYVEVRYYFFPIFSGFGIIVNYTWISVVCISVCIEQENINPNLSIR